MKMKIIMKDLDVEMDTNVQNIACLDKICLYAMNNTKQHSRLSLLKSSAAVMLS